MKRTDIIEELKESLGDGLCPYCPWMKDEVDKPRIGGCEGSYCDEALERYIDEENIKLKI